MPAVLSKFTTGFKASFMEDSLCTLQVNKSDWGSDFIGSSEPKMNDILISDHDERLELNDRGSNKRRNNFHKHTISNKEIDGMVTKPQFILPRLHRRTMDPKKSKEICDKIKKNVGIVLDKPTHPEFSVLSARLQTFKTWPAYCPARPDILSKCGFIYEGIRDRVKCYHCSIVIEGLTEDMDPWETHALEFGFCAHVRQCKGDEFILKVHGEDVQERVYTDNVDLTIERNSGAIEAAKSVYCFSDEQIRTAVQSFLDKNKTHFSGTELVKIIEDLDRIEVATVSSETYQISQNQMTHLEELSVDALVEENERLKSTYLCKVCFDDEARMIVLPCGHLCTCAQCVSALQLCPICRVHVQGTVRTQFSHSVVM